MFYWGLFAVETIPLLVLAVAWHFWRGTNRYGEWRHKLLLAGLVSATMNLAMYYAEVIYEFNFGNRNWIVFGYVGDIGLLLCLFSIVSAAAGIGGGRMLLALTALLSFCFWVLFTGPVFL